MVEGLPLSGANAEFFVLRATVLEAAGKGEEAKRVLSELLSKVSDFPGRLNVESTLKQL